MTNYLFTLLVYLSFSLSETLFVKSLSLKIWTRNSLFNLKMVVNLFSIFDPSGILFVNGWLVILLRVLIVPSGKYFSSYGLSIFFKTGLSRVKSEVDTPLGIGSYSLMSKGLISIFTFIVLINLIGLLPYVFTPTAHIVIPIRMAIPF